MTFNEEMSVAMSSGGVVDVPPGVFEYGAAEPATSAPVVIRGISTEGSVLRLSGDGLRFVGGANLALEDLTLDGQLLASNAAALTLSGGVVRLRLRRVRIRQPGLGIAVKATSVLDVIVDDMRADFGPTGSFLIGAALGSGESRVRMRNSRVSGFSPLQVDAENVVVADCRFEITSKGAGMRLGRGTGVRVDRTRFRGAARGGIVIATTGRGLSDVQVVHCTASGGTASVVRVESTAESFPVLGLWLDACSNTDPYAREGGILTVDGPGGFEPGDMRVRQPFMESDASPVTLMAGVDVMGVEARRRCGLSDEPTRAGGNWLSDTNFVAGTWLLPQGAVPTTLSDISLGNVPVLALTLGKTWSALSKSVPVNPIKMEWFGGERVAYVFSVMVRVKELDVGYPDDMELRMWVTAGSSNQVVGGSAKFTSHRLSTVWQRVSCVCYGTSRTLFRVHVSLRGDPGLTAYLFAPQFEIGHAPTPYQPREGPKLGPPRQLQAKMLGPMTIGYADSADIDSAGARLGDRFLNVRPQAEQIAGDEVDGWIVTPTGLKPMDPLGPDAAGCSTSPTALIPSTSSPVPSGQAPSLLTRVQDLVRVGVLQELERASKSSATSSTSEISQRPVAESVPPVSRLDSKGTPATKRERRRSTRVR